MYPASDTPGRMNGRQMRDRDDDVDCWNRKMLLLLLGLLRLLETNCCRVVSTDIHYLYVQRTRSALSMSEYSLAIISVKRLRLMTELLLTYV